MIKAAASELKPTKGVSKTKLTELPNLTQRWNPISRRCGADAGKQALIEQLAQMTSVMTRTNLKKAAEIPAPWAIYATGNPLPQASNASSPEQLPEIVRITALGAPGRERGKTAYK
jgi:hypothetical protein